MMSKPFSAQQEMQLNDFWLWDLAFPKILLPLPTQVFLPETFGERVDERFCYSPHHQLPLQENAAGYEDFQPSDEESKYKRDDVDIEVLKGCEYDLRFDPVGTTTRTRRVIICKFRNCDKEFIKAWNFLDHFRMHQGVRPFEWNICKKSFTQKGNLKKHQRQHFNTDVKDRKVHACHLCNKSYTERYNLRVSTSTIVIVFEREAFRMLTCWGFSQKFYL